MKKFIFVPVILFVAFLLVSGCYTYLSLSDGAQLAEGPYDEPYFPPGDPYPPPPGPIIIIYYPENPPSVPYQRPNDISDLRKNDGNGKNPVTDRQRR